MSEHEDDDGYRRCRCRDCKCTTHTAHGVCTDCLCGHHGRGEALTEHEKAARKLAKELEDIAYFGDAFEDAAKRIEEAFKEQERLLLKKILKMEQE